MFFFSDERCKFEAGNIQLQTECPFYEPGNSITGKVFLQIHTPVAATHIEIEFKGGEKCSFIRHYTETEHDGDETRVVHKTEKCKSSKTFLHEKNKVFPIADGMLQPGLYQIDFQLDLPHKIPASLNFKEKHVREEPKAKVKYYLKAKLENGGHDVMKYKQVLIIREKPVEWKVGEAQQETSEIKTWCCCDQGTSTMWSVFEKN